LGDVVTCDFDVTVPKHTITIDLSDADLPFMGLTGDENEVINSQNEIDASKGLIESLNDADKINSYVSWYLNGTLKRAEYPFLENQDSSESSKVVNYSGPINKLLPQDIQFVNRIKTIEQAKVTRHDQVVGCSVDVDPSLLGLWGEVFNVGKIHIVDIPIPCYTDGFMSFLTSISGSKKEHRLSEWDTAANKPPLISDYPKYADYLAAYKTWRGDMCAIVEIPHIIPIVGGQTILICVDNVFKSKFNSYLFDYIPMSSTEDVPGSISVDSAYPSTQNTAKVEDVTFSGEAAKLFFSHMNENDQLGLILPDTYAPKGSDKKGSPTNVNSQTSCNTIEVRSNNGDALVFDDSQISGELGYNAKFSCDFNANESPTDSTKCNTYRSCVPSTFSCLVSYGSVDCGSGYKCGSSCSPPVQECTQNIYINLTTKSSIPLADDIWSRLVAGPMSVFKRIFPKTGADEELGQIIDIPGSTNITYTGSGGTIVSQSNTDLKLPHIGGISEYFLKGIQTALRPKGYGEPLTFANVSNSNVPPGVCDGTVFVNYNPPSQTTPKANSYFTSYIFPQLSSDLIAVYKEAERQTGVPCEVLAGIHFEEASNRPDLDLQQGAPLNGRTLIESAIQAGHEIAAKVGGTISSWDDMITAVSYYNGGGNRNCGRGLGYIGPCPPPNGIDDPYATSWIDAVHDPMYLIYCWDHTQCVPTYPEFPYFGRPGVLTVATELYNSQ